MTGLLIVLYGVAIIATALLVAEAVDKNLDRRFPSYARGWARAFGESVEQLSHVRPATSPCACRACGQVGFCDEGCSRLDRLDAGEAHR